MKYLITFLLILTSCGPSDFRKVFGIRKFQVGDCVVHATKEPESWEINKPTYKIIELGHYAYRTLFIFNNHITGQESNITYGYMWEDFYQKVPCGDIK